MKRVATNVVYSLVVFAILVTVFVIAFAPLWKKEAEFRKSILAQKGKNLAESQRILGQPTQIMDLRSYEARRPNMAKSFEPDPQKIECEKVYEYHEIATMGLLFVRKDIVIDVYVGGT